MTLRLTAQQARLLHLAAQGLLSKPRRRVRKPDLLAAIERMQLLQIDTINVVARSPYLVLFSRLGAYPLEWLTDLLAEGAIFETWAHEACFAPLADYAMHRENNSEAANHWAFRHARRMHAEHRDSMDRLLLHVRERGAVKTSDFERREGGSGGWWGWKSEKRWLEAWFALGELMILRRDKFQRVYDLTERVLAAAHARPGGAGLADGASSGRAPDRQQVERRMVLKAVQALGVTQARWIADYFRTRRKHRDADLDELVDDGDLIRIEVDGWPAPGYVHRENVDSAQKAAAGRLRATHTTLLSPFDPLVWDRSRVAAMFDFEYRIECYTPEAKRQHGYFVLPILHGGRLVGRLDAKAHRASGEFEVRALFIEQGLTPDEKLAAAIAGAIGDCAQWHQTPRVTIRKAEPRGFAKLLRAAVTKD